MNTWYFSSNDKKLSNGDGRLIRKGTTHKVKGNIILCSHGLHSSKRIIDALKYARGTILWKVKPGGDIIRGEDKLVSSERTYIDFIDAGNVLRKSARLCALDVIHLWDAPNVVVKFLNTGDESLRAAAWAAAGDARDDAWNAGDARYAAWAAWYAWDTGAAWNAWYAAWAAARAAGDARDARAAQSKRLTRMVHAEFRRIS